MRLSSSLSIEIGSNRQQQGMIDRESTGIIALIGPSREAEADDEKGENYIS